MTSARSNPWDVFTDEHGNLYFYNAVTGESVWELPPEAGDDIGDDGGAAAQSSSCEASADERHRGVEISAANKDEYSAFEIAICVADAMVAMVERIEDATACVHDAAPHAKSSPTKKQKPRKFVSPAAEARHKRNAAHAEKRQKRQRDKVMAAYLQLALSHAEAAGDLHDSGLIGAVQLAGAAPHVSNQQQQQHAGARNIGALFTLDDTVRWRLEREVERIKQRRVLRKERQRHHDQVRARKQQHEMLQQCRTELTAHLLRQIECSTELQQQRILLLSSPQHRTDLEAKQRASMEPEMAERFAHEQQRAAAHRRSCIQKVFVLLDDAALGRLHLLQILFGIFTNERAQQYALQVHGLEELINTPDLQRFVLSFASSASARDYTVTLDDFGAFVAIVEDAVDHFTSVKRAVHDAEDEIDATLEAAASTPGVSRLRARVGIVSKKKVELEIAALRAADEQMCLQQEHARRAAFRSHGLDGDEDESALLAPKDEWEKHHHHRFIQFDAALPLYCCLCRRRKWDLERRDVEERESAHRSQWAARYALRVKEEELKLVASSEGAPLDTETSAPDALVAEAQAHSADASPSAAAYGAASEQQLQVTALNESSGVVADSDEAVVLDVLRSLVTLTERILSAGAPSDTTPVKQRAHRRAEAKRRAKSPTKKAKRASSAAGASDADVRLQLAMQVFEREESERKSLQAEDAAMHMLLERTRRALERPLLQVQDAASSAYIRMLTHIVNPSSLLYRLEFLRCLAMPAPQRLVLQMLDRSERSQRDGSCANYYVLSTLPCRNDLEADSVLKQLKVLEEHLQSPYVARIASVSRHTYQVFADSGMLVECWPILFVATEFLAGGTWHQHIHAQYLAHDDSARNSVSHAYARFEAHLLATLREIAAGLAAMHSVGVAHLNVSLDTIYISKADDTDTAHVRIAGFLVCKAAFADEQLRSGGVLQHLNFRLAPPEALTDKQPVTPKADVWMLGCALFEALVLWQQQQLQACVAAQRTGSSAQPEQPRSSPSPVRPIVHLLALEDVMQAIPIATTSTLRSLLRMVLQRNPAQRPQMSQVLDYLTFAGKQQRLGTTSR